MANNLPQLPEYWIELNLSDKENWIRENTPFRYVFNGEHLTSGFWYGGDWGTINNGGGAFQWLGDAIEAIERFWHNWQLA